MWLVPAYVLCYAVERHVGAASIVRPHPFSCIFLYLIYLFRQVMIESVVVCHPSAMSCEGNLLMDAKPRYLVDSRPEVNVLPIYSELL